MSSCFHTKLVYSMSSVYFVDFCFTGFYGNNNNLERSLKDRDYYSNIILSLILLEAVNVVGYNFKQARRAHKLNKNQHPKETHSSDFLNEKA